MYYKVNLDQFIIKQDKQMVYSICREERQYALFLYNALKKYGKKKSRDLLATDKPEIATSVTKILQGCGFSEEQIATLDIQDVFYEATFMRDLFERNRRLVERDNRSKPDPNFSVLLTKDCDTTSDMFEKEESFNARVLAFLSEELKQEVFLPKRMKELFITKEDESYENVNEEIFTVARCMMNSKPDVAVLYKENPDAEEVKLFFIECKFESYESKNGLDLPQTYVQSLIGKFLTSSHAPHNTYNGLPLVYSDLGAVLEFVRQTPKGKNSMKNKIFISDLIAVNEHILS